jgi:hypothetical protein
MKEILAGTIIGLEPKEQILVNLLLESQSNEQTGEIPGVTLRKILETTKDDLFHILERLLQKRIFGFAKQVIEGKLYIKAGEGYYIFDNDYTHWIPSSDSLFYKLCKLLDMKFNEESYLRVLKEFDIRNPIQEKEAKDKLDKITPYEIYDMFCHKYKRVFNKEYTPPNQYRDFGTIKKILCELSYKNFKDSQIKDFIEWCFMVKVREFKGNFIVGFLPLCLQDYLKMNNIEKNKPNTTKDEDGRLHQK